MSKTPRVRKWGPPDPAEYTKAKGSAHRMWCQRRGIDVDWETYQAQNAGNTFASGRWTPPRKWGPKDCSWTQEKATYHYKWCAKHHEASWEEYLFLKKHRPPNGRKWGSIGPSWDKDRAVAHMNFCRYRGISVDWETYQRLKDDEAKAVRKWHADRRSYGPNDDTWTRKFYNKHQAYCRCHGKMSWDEYQARTKKPPKPDQKPKAKPTPIDPHSHLAPTPIPRIIFKAKKASPKLTATLIPRDRPRDSVLLRDPADIIRKINRKAMGI